MLKPLLSVVLVLVVASAAWAGPVTKTTETAAIYDPLDHWQFSLESGALWSVGGNGSPLNYVILPQMLTFESPTWFGLGKIAGGDVVVRNRISLLLEPIVEGPEDYYFGVSGSGSIEWWSASRKYSMFLAAGGGVGWMNSKGHEIEGAQGQDFNFNWFVYAGGRYMAWERVSVSLGLMYQHISNQGQDDINPGIDSLGPVVGVTWHF